MRNKKELRYLPARELRVSTGSEGKTISGYAIVFDSDSVNLGNFVERISRSAVTKTLSGKPDILLLRDHSPSLVLGRTTSGTLAITTDDTGVFFRCLLPDTQSANDLAVSISRGDVSGCSFSFICEDDSWAQDSSGQLLRSLNQVSISELSVVSFPAYPATSVRSCPAEFRSLLDDSDDEDDEDDCDCERDEFGNLIDSECTCDDDEEDDEDDEDRSAWTANTLLQIEVARRK